MGKKLVKQIVNCSKSLFLNIYRGIVIILNEKLKYNAISLA